MIVERREAVAPAVTITTIIIAIAIDIIIIIIITIVNNQTIQSCPATSGAHAADGGAILANQFAPSPLPMVFCFGV